MSKRRKKKTKVRKPKKAQPAFTVYKDKRKLPTVDRKRLYTLLYRGQHEEICRGILEVLYYFQQHNFLSIDVKGMRRVDRLVSAIFAVVSDQDFQIPTKYVPMMISRGHLFANMVAISSYQTTDDVLQHLMAEEDNYFKLLFLYGVRNEGRIKVKALFDHDPTLASLWKRSLK